MTASTREDSVHGYKLWPANDPARADVLALLVGDGTQSTTQAAHDVQSLLRSVRLQGLRLELVVSAEGCGQRTAAAAIESPGGAALVLLGPSDERVLRADVAVGLLGVLQSRAWQRSVTLLQTLIPPEARRTAAIFREAGFCYLAELIYRHRPPTSVIPPTPIRADLTYVTYSPRLEGRFIDVMEASYVSSLDCPQLTGLRRGRDVLLGHKHTGIHEDSLWFLASSGRTPVGILLLSRVPGRSCLEVVYMGVVAEARGQGVGDALLSLAIEVARKRCRGHVTLAVDSTNRYANRLYDRWGFVEVARRRAWIARRFR